MNSERIEAPGWVVTQARQRVGTVANFMRPHAEGAPGDRQSRRLEAKNMRKASRAKDNQQ